MSRAGKFAGPGLVMFLALAVSACECNRASTDSAGGSPRPPEQTLYSSVAAGDLDGNGRSDLAVAYSTRGRRTRPALSGLAIHLQQEALDSRFAEPIRYRLNEDASAIALGDVDSDGKADVVAATESGLSVLLQDPSRPGRFHGARQYRAGPNPADVAIGDLNGDGRNDVAIANDLREAMGLTVLFQVPYSPAGFSDPVSMGTGLGTSSVAIADLDGDGFSDLVATNPTGVVLFLQEPASPGNFRRPSTERAGVEPQDVAVQDLDGDGIPDLAVSSRGIRSRVVVLLGDSGRPGRFKASASYDVGLDPSNIVVADLNGDGKPDLAVACLGDVAHGVRVDGRYQAHARVGAGYSILLQDSKTRGAFIATKHYSGPHAAAAIALIDPRDLERTALIILERCKGPLLVSPDGAASDGGRSMEIR